MGDLKVVLVFGVLMAVIALGVTAIIYLAPYILALVILLAIARMLVRLSGRQTVRDETHSPALTRPGND
jgi:hypothetical protein